MDNKILLIKEFIIKNRISSIEDHQTMMKTILLIKK